MKTTLQLRMGQQLTMTPQLQYAIRLLQLPTTALQLEIQKNLDNNPMLEIEDTEKETAIEALADQKTTSDSLEKYHSMPHTAELSRTYSKAISSDMISAQPVQQTTSLQVYLLEQVASMPFSGTETRIAISIIESLDDDGYLRITLSEIQSKLRQHLSIVPRLSKIEQVLHCLQACDPPGLFCCDLQDCLLMQLDRLNITNTLASCARELIKKHFHSLHSFKQLAQRTDFKTESIRAALAVIRRLNPRPGRQITEHQVDYVTPDIIANKVAGQWQVSLNPSLLPKLAVNQQYLSMLDSKLSERDQFFFKDALKQARWFLKSLQSRNLTLFRVASAIVQHQQDFLEIGEEAMKPLILSTIAKKLQLHESTVSRVINQKYVLTSRGVFELKYFFSSQLETKQGNMCSSTSIRAIIKRLIAQEAGDHPLTDSTIASLLTIQGIQIARRTVSKYRESMHILSSNKRKAFV